jgi:hypothetical protein
MRQRVSSRVSPSFSANTANVSAGPRQRDYFTSSPAFMLALAGIEGFEEVHLYGINLAIGAEIAMLAWQALPVAQSLRDRAWRREYNGRRPGGSISSSVGPFSERAI